MAVAEEANVPYETVLYMKKSEHPGRDAIAQLVGMLEDPVEDLVRKDSVFKKLELDPADYVGNPDAVIELLDKHLKLLQRPVIVKGNKAIIGRPRERVAPFLK